MSFRQRKKASTSWWAAVARRGSFRRPKVSEACIATTNNATRSFSVCEQCVQPVVCSCTSGLDFCVVVVVPSGVVQYTGPIYGKWIQSMAHSPETKIATNAPPVVHDLKSNEACLESESADWNRNRRHFIQVSGLWHWQEAISMKWLPLQMQNMCSAVYTEVHDGWMWTELSAGLMYYYKLSKLVFKLFFFLFTTLISLWHPQHVSGSLAHSPFPPTERLNPFKTYFENMSFSFF